MEDPRGGDREDETGFLTTFLFLVLYRCLEDFLRKKKKDGCSCRDWFFSVGNRIFLFCVCTSSLSLMTFAPSTYELPLLNARHEAARLVWAREHRDWSVEDWKRVAWRDESRFRQFNSDGRLRIWRQAHETMDPAYQVSLVSVPTSLNAIRYVLMGDHLYPFLLFCYPHGNGVFQQDNCTSHKSQLATGWLNVHSSYFSVISWPPRSLDINLIDHLCNVLEQGVKGHHTAPTKLKELQKPEKHWIITGLDLTFFYNYMRTIGDGSRLPEPRSIAKDNTRTGNWLFSEFKHHITI
ncbi:transposable element Tc1 transposase [Trichonephila clavipes]|nr:transposable element Tc1 transposase [Trichonephila clavipes]